MKSESSPSKAKKKGAIKTAPTKVAGISPRTPKPALRVPPILLEGDAPPAPPVSGPGHRYALGPTSVSPTATKGAEAAELPESYGTERLHLTARDPNWLYAHWDLSREQLKRYNSLSTH